MSAATHCDGPTCKEWVLQADMSSAGYITLQKKYKSTHFCSWPCLSDWLSKIDLVTGPEEM